MSAVPKHAPADKPAKKVRKVRRGMLNVSGLLAAGKGKGKGFASKKLKAKAPVDTEAKQAPRRDKAAKAPAVTPGVSEPVRAAYPKGVDAGWGQLGRSLDFLPVWKGLAVIAREDLARATSEIRDDLADRVRTLKQALVREGYPFPLVAVASTGLTPDVVGEVRRAGGRSIEVPSTFWKMDEAGRISAISERLPDPRLAQSEKPARSQAPAPRKPLDERRYRGASSRLDGEEISHWISRVSDPDAPPAELD